MQLEERPGPPGPYAAPDEIARPRPDVSTGETRYADIEYARVMGFRPLRMDPPRLGPAGQGLASGVIPELCPGDR